MRKGATLIEIIFTIAIAAILVVGASQMLKTLSLSAKRAKELSNLSLDTQSAINQISTLLYYRVPNSAIGYDGNANYESIFSMKNDNKILEWFGILREASMSGSLSNFIDMNASNFTSKTLESPGTNISTVNTILGQKFNSVSLANMAIFFAGSFDAGTGDVKSFGWHGSPNSSIYNVAASSSGTSIRITGNQPNFIYEKYYLADTAYAVARGEDILTAQKCISDLKVSNTLINDTLILFYNFRPWMGETFCADKGSGGNKAGNATVLALDVKGIRVEYENFTIRLSIDAERDIRGSLNSVHVTKQKVVF